MKKYHFAIIKILVFSILLVLSACKTIINNISDNEIPHAYRIGFVDERFELVSLVFRLAGKEEFSDTITDYQNKVVFAFSKYEQHPVVIYTKQNLHFGYDAVFGMAIHLEKQGNYFSLINNTDFLFDDFGLATRWTSENSAEFVKLLNDFYVYINFSEFFHDNTKYFMDISERFKNEVYNHINFEWFNQHGINSNNMRVVISPSSSHNGFGGWIYSSDPEETIVYAALPVSTNYRSYLNFVIHEFAHRIGNPIAKLWYVENEEFRNWSDNSVDLIRNPAYPYGLIMAFEYLTRAYTILYMVENTNANLLQLFSAEIAMGFPYIQNVYALITDHEIIVFDISNVLGIENYIIGDEHIFDFHGNLIKWYFLDLLGHDLLLENFIFTSGGNIFNSQTGDVLLVVIDDSKFLYIDIGSMQHRDDIIRMYSIFALD